MATNHRFSSIWSRTLTQVAWFLVGTVIGGLFWITLIAPISVGVAIVPG